jgi:hypothetical protein
MATTAFRSPSLKNLWPYPVARTVKVTSEKLLIILKKVRIRVKLSICLINSAACHEDLMGSRVIAPAFMTSALGDGE